MKKLVIILISIFVLTTLNFAYCEESLGLEINYGAATTQDSQVTLKVIAPGDLSKYYFQFSLDKQNWYGYDSEKKSWTKDYVSQYKEFYPDYYIGNKKGPIKIYVRGILGDDIITSYKSINLIPVGNGPEISKQISISESSYSDISIYGSGTKSSPYVVASGNERLYLEVDNAKYFSISYDGDSWSNYEQVFNNKINKKIRSLEMNTITPVYVKSIDEYGIVSEIKIVYFLIDNEAPNGDITTQYNNFLAIGGVCPIEIIAGDNLSDFVEYRIKLTYGEDIKYFRGRISIHQNGLLTSQAINLSNLPEGNISGNIVFTDKVGNQMSKKFSIVSY